MLGTLGTSRDDTPDILGFYQFVCLLGPVCLFGRPEYVQQGRQNGFLSVQFANENSDNEIRVYSTENCYGLENR